MEFFQGHRLSPVRAIMEISGTEDCVHCMKEGLAYVTLVVVTLAEANEIINKDVNVLDWLMVRRKAWVSVGRNLNVVVRLRWARIVSRSVMRGYCSDRRSICAMSVGARR
jgi:hypothetical protein